MFTLKNLLINYGVDPALIRFVRHGNKHINIIETFHNDFEKFITYCSWQLENKYSDAKYLAMFAPSRGTTALFLGIRSVEGVTNNNKLENKHLEILNKHNFPNEWIKDSAYYHLLRTDLLADLSERLVIEWGGSTISWVQKQDKQIVQIKPKNSIDEFSSYDNVQLSYRDLKKLITDSDSNFSWVNALSSVNGVYLILDKISGKLYVGSAYGKGGIFGRWSTYARTGHGGNKLLKTLNPENFEFSILEISPSTMSADEVISRENRWKKRLGSRIYGLNDN